VKRGLTSRKSSGSMPVAFIVQRGEKIAALPAITALGKNTSWGTDIDTRIVVMRCFAGLSILAGYARHCPLRGAVPYRGGAPMVTDLIAGQVQVGFDVMVTSLPHVRTGALWVLGVAGNHRFDMLPDVPTVAETESQAGR
jgi:Tripartite tricarboxylate transporter family receptor